MTISANQKRGFRYRRISTQMYADERFVQLSALKPSGQALWIFLLTGPLTTLIPGVIAAGVATIAERLRWRPADVRCCLFEIIALKMAVFDESGPLLFLPNGLRHNPPQNPSVVAGWRQAWFEVPACRLKSMVADQVRAVLAEEGETYAEAFDLFASPLGFRAHHPPHDVGHHVPHLPPHQEQEQDQEQDPPPTPSVIETGPEQLRATWNALTKPPIPRCRDLTPNRRRHARTRLRERPLKEWENVVRRIQASLFCRGENERGWTASFDWLIGSPDVAVKVLEGKYDERAASKRQRDGATAQGREVPDANATRKLLEERERWSQEAANA